MASVLQRSWRAKKETALGVTTPQIETLHQSAIDAGAMAGKVSGARGGGFIMFMAPPKSGLT
jgi:D-glycero-alpha-D-manno-heptose-7-phosphate kinase